MTAPMILPDAALAQHIAITGRTGSGKTFACKGFVEHLLDLGRRVCIIDPTDAWHGLRSSADGTKPGYPVIVFGGDHADVPINAHSGAALAEFVATQNAPSIIATADMHIDERRRFMADFLDGLYRLNKGPLHLIVDEADEIGPQNPMPDTKVVLHRIDRIVRRGRIRGFRVIMITQRPAVLNKNLLTQASTLIAMRLMAPQDRKAIDAWIEGQGDVAKGKEVLGSLATLRRGEGWVWSPDFDILKRVDFPRIKTFDSSRAPTEGETAEPTKLADVDLTAIRQAFAAAEAEAAANDPKLLRKRIAELERDAKRQQPAEVDPAAIELAREDGYEDGFSGGYEHAIAETDGLLRGMREQATGLVAAIDEAIAEAKIRKPPERSAATWDGKSPLLPPSNPAEIRRDPPRRAAPTPTITPSVKGARGGGAELRILRVLAQRHPARFTEAQWATLAGMKRSGGTWGTYKSRLRVAGFIADVGGTFMVTPEGLKAAGEIQPAPQGPDEVIAMWKAAVGSGPARMLDELVAVYPRGVTRETLAGRVGMTVSGGTFGTYLSRLRSNGLIEPDGSTIRASSTIMEG